MEDNKPFAYTVYEHNEKADPIYRGTRFYTRYHEDKVSEDSIFDIVGHVNTDDEALALIAMEKKNGMLAHIQDMAQIITAYEKDFIAAYADAGAVNVGAGGEAKEG